MRYNFITIEGNIGAGKTSLATRIAERLNGRLVLEQFADNPFLPKFYENPDKHAFPLELSFLAERYQQLKDILSSQELFTDFTISDYYINKSLIFANATLQDDEFQLFSRLFHIMYGMLPKPDLLVYLYLDVERLQENIKKRGRDYEQNIEDEYLLNINASYFEFIKKQRDQRVLIIDTNGVDFVNNENDYEKIVQIIDQEWSKGIHRVVL
jgi:deoxyguanosine kinase